MQIHSNFKRTFGFPRKEILLNNLFIFVMLVKNVLNICLYLQGPDAANKLPTVTPHTKCRLRLLKQERIKASIKNIN